jgi:hypothetical protein
MSPSANSAFSSPQRFPGSQSRLIVSETRADWLGTARDRLENLIRLESGWDGYSAPHVSLENANFALQMLSAICPPDAPAPQIVPGSRGDLQVEWHTLNTTIELHVRAANAVTAWRESESRAPEGEEIELTNDFLRVLDWVKEMLEDVRAADAAAA